MQAGVYQLVVALAGTCQVSLCHRVSLELVHVCCSQHDGVLSNWVIGTDPCASGWNGISCNCSDIHPYIVQARACRG